MGNDNEITAKLKVDTQQAEADVKAAGIRMAKGIADSSAAASKMTQTGYKTVMRGGQMVSLGKELPETASEAWARVKADTVKGMGGWQAYRGTYQTPKNPFPGFLPQSMQIKPPMLPGPTQSGMSKLMSLWSSGGLGRGLIGGVAGQVLGGSAGSMVGMAAGGPLGLAMAAITANMLAFRKVLHETTQAMERARNLYAMQLRSGGMPAGFVQQRYSIAKVMGVGEQEIFQYGAAFNYLNQRLAYANAVIVQTAPGLTAVSYEFAILDNDMKALWATISEMLSPAIEIAILGLESFVEWLIQVAEEANKHEAKVYSSGGGILGGLLGGPIGGIIGSILGIELAKKGGGEISRRKLEPPAASMHQLPSSSWERMGLVMGLAGGQNWNKETAENTREMVRILSGKQQSHGNFRFNRAAHSAP